MLASESQSRDETLSRGVPDLRGKLGWTCDRVHKLFSWMSRSQTQ